MSNPPHFRLINSSSSKSLRRYTLPCASAVTVVVVFSLLLLLTTAAVTALLPPSPPSSSLRRHPLFCAAYPLPSPRSPVKSHQSRTAARLLTTMAGLQKIERILLNRGLGSNKRDILHLLQQGQVATVDHRIVRSPADKYLEDTPFLVAGQRSEQVRNYHYFTDSLYQ